MRHSRFQSADRSCPRLDDGGLHWSKHSILSKPDDMFQGFREGAPLFFAIPLRDAMMYANDLSTTLPTALHLLFSTEVFHATSFMEVSKLGMGVAQLLALGEDYAVRPIPGELYSSYDRYGRSSAESRPKALSFSDGWTLVIVHEKPSPDLVDGQFVEDGPQAVRTAFVTAGDRGGDLQVKSIDQFVHWALNRSPDGRQAEAAELTKSCKESFARRLGDGVKFGHCSEAEAKKLVSFTAAMNGVIDEREARFGWMRQRFSSD